MKILYDYQIFSSQKFGGISRYLYEIMKGVDYDISLLLNQNAYYKDKGILITKSFRGKSRIFNFVNYYYTKLKFPYKKYDIFHPTYYNPYFLDYISKSFVLTIHDMIHEKFSNLFPKTDKTSERKKLLAGKANRIIAVSNQTKLDIIEILKIPEKKIDVVYHGSDFDFIEENKEVSQKLPKRYILFTGVRNSYKNFTNFIKALKKFFNKDKELFLICAGGGSFKQSEVDLFREIEIEKQIIQYSCNDGELKSLYINALFFVFPSLYEGFGIPLLEAMACNTPILCSKASCFPEIVQDSALMFDPYSIKDMEEKIGFALHSDLSNFVENGKKRFKEFSWDKTRNQTKSAYKKVLKNF